jgi:CheY-like chemotaxis protein
MSLTGNLEDLPLLDIIQIVSFSKKTGFLTIGGEKGEAAIVFREGFVVSSFSWDSLPIDPRVQTLPEEKRFGLIRNRIEMALEQLIRLREGPFGFHLTDTVPDRVGSRDIALETLPVGINPQELLLDLARGIDEDRRDSSAALEASFADPQEALSEKTPPAGIPMPEPRAPEPEPETREAPVAAAPPAPDKAAPLRTILLVDDEEDVRSTLGKHFRDGGFDVLEAGDPDSALKTAGRLGKEETPFILVTDLGMPTSGGSSFQGGFEVVKRMWKMGLHPPVLMMTESLNSAIQARARQMEISSFVFKPGLSKLDPPQFVADLKAFAGKLLDDVIPSLAAPAERLKRARIEREKKPASEKHAVSSKDELAHQFSALQRRLDALRNRGDANEISMTVIRVAREFFERGILLLVKNEQLRGLGAFGIGPADENLNLLVRDIVIPLSEPSPFVDAVVEKKSSVGPIPEGKWARHLMGRIGRFKSTDLAFFPLVAHRETIALLLGDNPETGRAFPALDAFEVFLDQAGVALENAFLQRKLDSLQEKA